MSTFVIPKSREQRFPSAENLFKSILYISLLGVSFYSCDQFITALETTAAISPWAVWLLKWLLLSMFAIVNGVLLVGIAVLAHDAVHRALFHTPVLNEAIGSLLSALVLVPFYSNRQYHLTHHGYAHQAGFDPEEPMHNHSFYFAATIGSFIGLGDQFLVLLRNLIRFNDPRRIGRSLMDLVFIGAALAIYFVLVPALGIALAASVYPAIVGFLLCFAFRGLSDHYGVPSIDHGVKQREDIVDANEKTWQAGGARRRREVVGWVVLTTPWLEWLWSHVNYHEVHHKYPYLSHRYLPQTFEATRAQHPYLVVRGYWRSLLNQRKRRYYTSPEEVRAFLSAAVAGSPSSE